MNKDEQITRPLNTMDYLSLHEIYVYLAGEINAGTMTEKEVLQFLLDEDDDELSGNYVEDFIEVSKETVYL